MYDSLESSADLARAYERVRATSLNLADPLTPEDQTLQSMEDASPTKWNLAHTSWFFENFLLSAFAPDYEPFHPAFGYLFNSYYQQVGKMHPRPARGLLSRPTVEEVRAYRAHVDAAMRRFIEAEPPGEAASLIALGLAHEEQHQELLLTDIKHALSLNPLDPAPYAEEIRPAKAPALEWVDLDGGVAVIGHDGGGFFFDNEGPAHDVLLRPFLIASRPATNGDFLAFMNDGGYERSELWLSDGWARIRAEGWSHPIYWRKDDDGWSEYTLFGRRAVDPDAPLAHISFYEAAAFAEWAQARLPTEPEWEVAARSLAPQGPAADECSLRGGRVISPYFAESAGPLQSMFGAVWEWTVSSYSAYPGYRPAAGAVGEYNGKFMCNQMVLRGGSCATPEGHVRPTYRNFFPADARWQFSGVRLAKDA